MWVQISKRNLCEKGYISNPAKCACQNGKYLGSIIDNSVIYDESFETTESILTKTAPKKYYSKTFQGKRVICKIKNLYILFAFLLTSRALLIAVSICCYYIKHQGN